MHIAGFHKFCYFKQMEHWLHLLLPCDNRWQPVCTRGSYMINTPGVKDRIGIYLQMQYLSWPILKDRAKWISIDCIVKISTPYFWVITHETFLRSVQVRSSTFSLLVDPTWTLLGNVVDLTWAPSFGVFWNRVWLSWQICLIMLKCLIVILARNKVLKYMTR